MEGAGVTRGEGHVGPLPSSFVQVGSPSLKDGRRQGKAAISLWPAG